MNRKKRIFINVLRLHAARVTIVTMYVSCDYGVTTGGININEIVKNSKRWHTHVVFLVVLLILVP